MAGVMVATLVAAIALGSLSPGSTVSILALWTTGLRLFLPFPLYLISLGLFLVKLFACRRSSDAARDRHDADVKPDLAAVLAAGDVVVWHAATPPSRLDGRTFATTEGVALVIGAQNDIL